MNTVGFSLINTIIECHLIIMFIYMHSPVYNVKWLLKKLSKEYMQWMRN